MTARRPRRPVVRWESALLAVVIALAASLLVAALVVPTILLAGKVLAAGPPLQALSLSERRATILLRTFGIAAGAAAVAMLLALPPLLTLLHGRSHRLRAVLVGLALFPLLTPPGVFGYAWMLAVSQAGPLGRVLTAVGLGSPEAAALRAAIALGNWLWPIPVLILAAAYQRGGATAYRLARLDASSSRALLRAVVPALRAPILAALALLFLLALNDGTIPPLVLAHTWPAETAPELLDTALYGSPAAAVLWSSWPVWTATLLAAAIAGPTISRILRTESDDEATDADTGAPLAGPAIISIGLLLSVGIALLPILVFFGDMFTVGGSLGPSFGRAWTLYRVERRASLIVAALAFAAAALVGMMVAAIVGRAGRRPSAHRAWSTVLTLLAVALPLLWALLPPGLIAQVLIEAFNRPGVLGWLYDETPLPWLCGLLARFAFLPIAAAWLAARLAPPHLLAQAVSDGATPSALAFRIVLPLVWRPLMGAAIILAGLSLADVPIAAMLVPPRFGGSLAVAIDNQMHYGRNMDLIATTIIQLVPAAIAAAAVPPLLRRPPSTTVRTPPAGPGGAGRVPRRTPLVLSLACLLLLGACHMSPPSDADSVEAVFGSAGVGNGEFSYPRAIAVSPVDGCVFVCDKAARLQRFSPDGDFEAGWRMPEWENGKPTGMSCDSQGRLWVADTHYSRVIVYDRDGVERRRFGRNGRGPGDFIMPTCVGWDAAGNVYVGEYGGNDRISKFTPDLDFITSFGGPGSGEAALERPTQIRCDEQGVLWVSDACHHRVCRFDAGGRFLGSFGGPGETPDCLNFPYDLELRPGRVLLAEFGGNRISEFDRAGRFLRAWGSPGRLVGEVMHPWGVAAGAEHRLYVLDSWNNRVQVLRW